MGSGSLQGDFKVSRSDVAGSVPQARDRGRAGCMHTKSCEAVGWWGEAAFKGLRKAEFGQYTEAHAPFLCSPERFKHSSKTNFPLVLVNRADD